MADEIKTAPLTEPLIVLDIFAMGADIEMINGNIRVTSWVVIGEERRIVGRTVYSNTGARGLNRDLRKALTASGH